MLLLTKYTVLYKENEICCIILLSLPSRERGLKSYNLTCFHVQHLSLPSRERGLKSWVVSQFAISGVSLPSRERGLKYSHEEFTTKEQRVAPFAGAWIEIISSPVSGSISLVAPFAGAWIEIYLVSNITTVS